VTEPRIWDCVTYFDELDHLQARFEVLDGLVAGHIVCEGDATHQGAPKELLLGGVDLPDNVIRLASWLRAMDPRDPWRLENAQRDYIGHYVQRMGDFRPDDILIVADVDEHVNPEVIPLLAGATAEGPISLGMRMMYFGLDWEDDSLPYGWLHPKALRVRDIPASLSELRLAHAPGHHHPVHHRAMMRAGWHISYTGGPERRAAKLRAYAHAEQNNPETHARIATAHETGIGPNGEQLVAVTDWAGIPEPLVRRFG
jgi:beta-1,4-mannosyl-glycoprotein beta-1,4-N-acetylglucosaminyltransferase